MEGCRKFDLETKAGITVAVSKETLRVISDSKLMLRRCLLCKFFSEKCDRTRDLVELLSENIKWDDWC